MLDDFFIRALIAGLGIAIVTGPLGCFVIWRRLSYFGDTLAHSALLGVTLAYTLEFNIAHRFGDMDIRNKKGANLGNKADDIYIDCQPVGSDGQLLVNESISADSMGGGDVNMEKLEPLLWVIVAIIGAVAISKGIEYVLNHFKKNKSN